MTINPIEERFGTPDFLHSGPVFVEPMRESAPVSGRPTYTGIGRLESPPAKEAPRLHDQWNLGEGLGFK